MASKLLLPHRCHLSELLAPCFFQAHFFLSEDVPYSPVFSSSIAVPLYLDLLHHSEKSRVACVGFLLSIFNPLQCLHSD